MSPQEATNMLPHAARACCGPVLEALIRQGADLNSFNFQRGALTAGGAPFAIVATTCVEINQCVGCILGDD